MSVLFVHREQEVWSIGSNAVRVFLAMTRLVQSELGGMPAGFSPVVSDEIWIDHDCFIEFVDEFFEQAKANGTFRYFVAWAEEVAGMYENLTGTTPPRCMLGVPSFRPIRYKPAQA